MLPIKENFSADQGPQFGTFEAAFELANMDTFVSGLARDTALEDMTGKQLSPEELNTKYPFVEKPFTKPMPEVAAFHLNEEAKKRRALQDVINNGPGGKILNQAVNLGAGIVAHALDPVEFGVGAITGGALSKIGAVVAGRATTYGAIARAGTFLAESGGGSAGSRFAFEAAEGMLGNALLEPMMYAQSKRAQLDYGLEDAFVSVVGGGIAAPAAVFGLRKTWGGLFNKSAAATDLAVRSSVSQVEKGISPNVDLVNKAHEDFIFKEPSQGVNLGEVRASYRFEPLDPSKVNEKVFYVAGEAHDKRVIGEFFGEGLYATDNPNFANNLAAHPMEQTELDVREIRLDSAKILDGNDPNTDLLNNVISGLPEGKLKKTIFDTTNIQEAWTKIRNRIDLDLTDEDAKLFLDAFQKRGYDGIAMTDEVRGHNSLFLFEGSQAKAIETAKFRPDSKALPTLDETELNKVRDEILRPENQIGFDLETYKQTKDFALSEDLKLTGKIEQLATDTADRIKRFEELAKNKLLDSESVKELDKIKERQQNIAKFKEVAEDYAHCLDTIGA